MTNEEQTGFALLAGYVLDRVQADIDRMREALTAMVDEKPKQGGKRAGAGRPKKQQLAHVGQLNAKGKPIDPNSYWGKMTPEQRSAEMLKRAAKRGKESHAKASKSGWAGYTPAQRKQRIANVVAGKARAAAARVNGAA